MIWSSSSNRKSSTPLLITGFIVMIALAVLFASISLQEYRKIAELNDKIYQHPFAVSNAVLEVNSDIVGMHLHMKDVMSAKNQDELEQTISLVEEHEQAIYRHFELIKERFLGAQKTVDAAFAEFVDWKNTRDEIIKFKRNDQHEEATSLFEEKEEIHIQAQAQRMNVLIDFARNTALEFKNHSQKAYEDSLSSLYGLLAFIVLSSITTAIIVIALVRKAEKDLKTSEVRFADLFKNSQIAIWSEDFSAVITALNKLRIEGITDLKQHLQQNKTLAWELASLVKVNSVNEATLKLFGATTEKEFIPKIDKTFGENAIDVFIEELCAIWNKQHRFHAEANYITFDGKPIKAIVTFHIPDKESDFTNLPVSIVDITARTKAEKQLQLSAQVISHSHEGIIITDANRAIIDVNPAFTEITGYSSEDVIGKNPSILNSGKQDSHFYAHMWRKINEVGYWQGEIWNRRKSGETYAELLNISSLKNVKGNIVNYVGMFTDITHSKRQQDYMKKMAHYDALTNLPNRTLLTDRFNQALARAKRSNTLLAVCFLDLDDFKPVNDDYGHDMGDNLLIEVANRLELAVRNEDTISRLGGDEFSLLLGDLKSPTECYELLERIIQSISNTYSIGEESINISASIGVSLYPADDTELDVLLRNADQAMYLAKQEGKNKFRFFDLTQAQKVAEQHLKLQEIEQAFVNDELCLYYQPKVNMVSGEVTGVEALIRWQHPEKGIIPPIQFLPIIEGTKLELEIGDWVIEQGLALLERLTEQEIKIEVSVNVSSNQFLNPPFFDKLSDALEHHHNINSRNFQLEVLESSALGNLEQINNIIIACKNELGVSIALDDFGTGYSSLSHLSKLPADTIKIDQGFVRNVIDDPNDYAIIDGVIALSRSFNKELIAEGVETTEHGLLLILMGCNHAQGYAISRPMPASELIGWLKHYTPNSTWLDSKQYLTPQARRIKQLELILNNWQQNVESLLSNNSDNQPEINPVNCHLGKWIKQLRQEQLFKESWLNALQHAHYEMHSEAKKLLEKHQPEVSLKEDELSRLHMAFNKIQAIMEKYE